MKKVLVPLAEGFEEIEAVASIDILRRGGVEVVTASITDDLQVLGAHHIKMMADELLEAVIGDEYDAILLPGGGLGTQNLKACGPLLERLRDQRESGGLVCAICAAPTVLAEAGVLAKEHFTCYPGCENEIGRASAGVPVVADGQIVTGQAPGAAVLFGLVVLRHLCGDEIAAQVADGMVTRL